MQLQNEIQYNYDESAIIYDTITMLLAKSPTQEFQCHSQNKFCYMKTNCTVFVRYMCVCMHCCSPSTP